MAEAKRYFDPETGTFLPGARINIEQYEILKRCAEADGDISEWQKYRKDHPDEEIWLCGADLSGVVLKSPAYEAWRKDHDPREMTVEVYIGLWELWRSGGLLYLGRAHLDGADLHGARLYGAYLFQAHLDGADFHSAHLDGAFFFQAHLYGANLFGADLDGALLRGAHLHGAHLTEAHLDGANLQYAHLDGAFLWLARLEGADLRNAHLAGANLTQAHLDGADLEGVRLDGAELREARLDGADLAACDMRGTDLRMASVNGQTVITDCRIDRRTDATGVPLDAARVEPGLKQLLEYNVRRIAWERWYRRLPVSAWQETLERFERQKKPSPRHLLAARAIVAYFKRLGVQWFWWLSDYGRRTWSILAAFALFAAYFTGAYCLYPSCLMVNGEVGALRGLWHALYFSIVTQTTLGFGDIHANPASPYGQLLLMLQVILGYVLLGALVTRFAVLFSAGGPAGRFSPRPK